jgi:hypothetical protein
LLENLCLDPGFFKSNVVRFLPGWLLLPVLIYSSEKNTLLSSIASYT